MEDGLSGKGHQWKRTSVEDDLSGRRPQRKTTSMEDDLSGIQPHWKTNSVEDDLSGKGPQWKMTLLASNQQNICWSTPVESETILKRWKMASMEDNINISSTLAGKPT